MAKFTIGAVLLLAGCSMEPQDTVQPAPETSTAPIHLISSFPAVGSSSRTARIIAPKLEEYFQRPVEIIYNEGGQGGDIGARMAASADPDQLTLFVGTVGNVTLLPNILSSYNVDPLQDFRPVTQLTVTPDVLIAHAGLGVDSLDELVAYAADTENGLSYSHIAPLSIHRMEFLQLFDDLDIEAQNDASIRGSAAAMEAVGSGAVDLVMTTAPYVAPLVEEGLVVPLAVANETRLPAFPDVPTMAEAGIAIPHGSWAGALMPAATSDQDVEHMFRALQAALTDPGVVAQIAELGMVAAPSASPASFSAYIEAETARLGQVARKFNVVESGEAAMGTTTTAEAENMALLAHHPLDGRPSYQPMPHQYGDRWILFAGHHAGEAVNSLNGKLEGNGTSVLDVTDPRNPVYLAHIAAPSWEEHGSMSLGTGAQHAQVCNGTDLPDGDPDKVYLLRSLGNVSHEVYDVTEPSAPEFLVTVVWTGDSPPMEPGADFYATKGTHKNWWDCETGVAYVTSSITGWKKWRNLQAFDLSRPEEPVHIRDFNLVGTEPTATIPAVDAPGGYSGIHQPTILGNRIYLAYGMDSDGVIQILDRDKFLRGDPNAEDPFAPTPENFLYPEIARIDLPSYWGGHSVHPILGMEIADYADDEAHRVRDILVVVSEVTANECGNARHAVFFVDITEEDKPFGISSFQVPEASGDFCNRGGRFGPHASNDSMASVYYKNTLFLSYFNAGVRAVDIRDPFNPQQIAYYIPAITANTDERCVEVDGEPRCKTVIQTNNVNYDPRGVIYALDRANTGLHILELTGSAREGAGLPE